MRPEIWIQSRDAGAYVASSVLLSPRKRVASDTEWSAPRAALAGPVRNGLLRSASQSFTSVPIHLSRSSGVGRLSSLAAKAQSVP